MIKENVLIKEVERPLDNVCSSGHLASEVFQGEPTRFFKVRSEVVCGIYCEACLIIANAMVKDGKSRRTSNENS